MPTICLSKPNNNNKKPQHHMLITEDLYNDLVRRIDAGEFLTTQKDLDLLPPLPTDANEETKSYQAQCQDTIDLYQAKMKAMEAQVEGWKKVLEEKEATDRANLMVKGFNDTMEKQFEDYRNAAESTITQQKTTLQEMRNQMQNLVDENTKLKKEKQTLTNKLQKRDMEILKLEEMQKEWENQLMKNQLMMAAESSAKQIITESMLQEKDVINQLQEENKKLLKEISKKEKDPLKMAQASIGYCTNYLVELDEKDAMQTENIVLSSQRLLLRLVKHGFEKYIDATEIAKLSMTITGVDEQREAAKKQRHEEERKAIEEKKRKDLELAAQQNQIIKDAIGKPTALICGTYNENVSTQTNNHAINQSIEGDKA